MEKHALKSITLLAFALTLNPLFSDDAAKPDDAEALAMKLQNPVANLISVPFQNNLDLVSALLMPCSKKSTYNLYCRFRLVMIGILSRARFYLFIMPNHP